MSLISLANFKSFIHMGENYDDVNLQNLIDGVEAEIATYIGFDLAQVIGDIEYHDGDRSNTILLDNGLITTAPTVDVDSDGDYTYATNLVDGVDFVWYPNGTIQLITGGYFPKRQRYIRVTYTHGYLTNPLVATNLPTNIGFVVYKNRAVKVCSGHYAGLANVVLNPLPAGGGVDWAESIDYAVMDDTGEVVIIETGGIADGATVYVSAGTYSEYSNLPSDLELNLKKKMSNVYYGSRQVMEIDISVTRIFSDKEIYGVFDRYARVQI